MKKFKKIFIVMVVVVLAFMVLGATVVLASPVGQGILEGGAEDSTRPPLERGLLAQIFDREAVQAVVADTLGISVEELQAAKEDGVGLQQLAEAQGVALEDIRAAVEAYKVEAVQDALDNELITADQAEWLLNHDGRLNRRQIRRGAMNLMRIIIDPEVMKETAADALGITVEQLEAARQDGTTMAQLAEEQGVEIETVQEAMRAAFEDMVEQAVQDGTITQIQADNILDREGRPRPFINRPVGLGNGADG